MKTIGLILLLITLCISNPIQKDSIYTFINNQAFLLKEGLGNITAKDSGITAVVTRGELWAHGKNENFHITLPVGTALLNGVAWIQSDEKTATIKVVKGYLRFTSVGGFPGETITAGYTRIVTKESAIAERKFNALTTWKNFCLESPDEGWYFGCPRAEVEPEPAPKPVDLSNSVIVLIHKPIAKQDLSHKIEQLSPHTMLAETLKDPKQRIVPLVDISTDLLFTLELSRQQQPYIIVDMRIEEHPNKLNTLYVTIDLYDGVKKRSSSQMFTAVIQTTLSTETYKDELYLSEEFFQLVKRFIFQNISAEH